MKNGNNIACFIPIKENSKRVKGKNLSNRDLILTRINNISSLKNVVSKK